VRKKHAFSETLPRSGDRVLPGAPLSHIDQSGYWREKFAEILEDSDFVWHGCGHGAAGGVFCDATKQELSKSSCDKPRYRPGTSMDCK
jgi:hypothetical protein